VRREGRKEKTEQDLEPERIRRTGKYWKEGKKELDKWRK